MQSFPLKSVRLTYGVFKNAQDVDLKYILALNTDKLLAPYLIDAGLPLKAERYGNWESSGLDGHIGGHYLSALAMMYASTKNSELKTRLDYMVSELARCQAKNGNDYVGGIPQGKVFWQRIHNKIPETEQLSKNFVLKISANKGVYSPRIHQIRLTIKL